MKKLIVALCLVLTLAIAGSAVAAEKLLVGEIQSVTIALDKNGNEYVRAIVSEQKELNGIKYAVGIPVMFFGDMVPAGKSLTEGSTFKGIVSGREYNGRTSYTVIKPTPVE